MTTRTPAQKANELISLYVKLWEDKYGKKPTINRYKWKWAYQDMIQDLGMDNAKAAVEFFFRTDASGHPMEKLAYNYDSLHEVRLELDEQDRKATAIRKETRRRVEEFERRTKSN